MNPNPNMTLKLWLEQEGITIQELADRARVDRGYVSKMVSGRIHPSLAVALDVRDATRGEVTLEQMLPLAFRPAVKPRQQAAPKSPGTAQKPPAPKASGSRAAA